MKRITHSICTMLLLMLCKAPARSQNWQLVWADEFNTGTGPDWVFETGNAPAG